MAEIARLNGCTDWIDLDFVERQRTPEPAMKIGIQLQLAGLSLSNTVSILEEVGVGRSRKSIHDWVQKADVQPAVGRSPNHVALDETAIRINDEQFWLYAAADPETNDLLHPRLFSTTTTALTEVFSPRTSPETRCRTCRFPSRWRSTPPNCAGQSWPPISNGTDWKSECHQTNLSRIQAQNFSRLKLFQPR